MRHQALRVNGASLHIAELGEGAPLLLLHGWPEFWLTWEPVMLRLSKRYRLVAPDLRGFGGAAMQPLARKAPERVAGLFFFDFVYPGIGPRMGAPDQTDMAPALVGASRLTCETYISYFLRHWSFARMRSTMYCRISRKIF